MYMIFIKAIYMYSLEYLLDYDDVPHLPSKYRISLKIVIQELNEVYNFFKSSNFIMCILESEIGTDKSRKKGQKYEN